VAERKSRSADKPEDTEAEKVPPEAPATAAAPLTAPPVKKETPELAPTMATPNAVTPHVFAADNTVRLLADDGSELTVDDLFDYPTLNKPGTLARVRQRVYREYTHPGAKTKTTQLLYPANALVSIFEAEKVKAELRERLRQAAEAEAAAG
jgi:hypothetical protein